MTAFSTLTGIGAVAGAGDGERRFFQPFPGGRNAPPPPDRFSQPFADGADSAVLPRLGAASAKVMPRRMAVTTGPTSRIVGIYGWGTGARGLKNSNTRSGECSERTTKVEVRD